MHMYGLSEFGTLLFSEWSDLHKHGGYGKVSSKRFVSGAARLCSPAQSRDIAEITEGSYQPEITFGSYRGLLQDLKLGTRSLFSGTA